MKSHIHDFCICQNIRIFMWEYGKSSLLRSVAERLRSLLRNHKGLRFEPSTDRSVNCCNSSPGRLVPYEGNLIDGNLQKPIGVVSSPSPCGNKSFGTYLGGTLNLRLTYVGIADKNSTCHHKGSLSSENTGAQLGGGRG